MAKGTPVTGDRFTERTPYGVMGKIYGTLGSLPYFAAKDPRDPAEQEATDFQVSIRRRRRSR